MSGKPSRYQDHIPGPDEISALDATQFKTYENLLRRMAQRQGWKLTKNGRRDPRALDYGRYYLVSAKGKYRLTPKAGASLPEVHRLLLGE